MATILFNEIVFGPIMSRRLGRSLGINLSPAFGKFCNFDCIYCECGFNKDGKGDQKIPDKASVKKAIEERLKQHTSGDCQIDTITFSGNGEPTIHPDFSDIIDFTIELRDMYAPKAKISVLSNASRIDKLSVVEALLKIDNPILKIDSAIDKSVYSIDRPQFEYSTEKLVEQLIPFSGKFVLQTMFLRGDFNGEIVDNTTKEEIEAWRNLVYKIKPREIMIYTIDRETPAKNLTKVNISEMERIAAPLIGSGIKVQIRG